MTVVSILDKEELVASIDELLEDNMDELLAGTITTWDLANDIAVLVLK